MADHVHMLMSIPPKYAVSQVVGYIKGKSAIHLARVYGERQRNYRGQHFWARGDCVSTVGRDEAVFDDQQGHLRCSMHGIVFDPTSGESLSVLCAGERLEPLRCEEIDGQVYLVDKRVTAPI